MSYVRSVLFHVLLFSAGGIGTVPQVFSQDQIPDDINFKKYESIYLEKKTQSDTLRNDAERRRKEAQSLDQQLQYSHANLDSNDREIRRLLDLSDQRARQIDRLYQENQSLDRDRENLFHRINSNHREMEQLSRRLGQLNKRIEDLKNRRTNAQNRLNSLDQTIAQLNQQLQNKSNELNRLSQSKNQIVQTISQLSSQIESLSSQISQKEAQVPTLQNQISNLQSQIPSLQASENKLASQLNSKQNEVNSLSSQFNSQQTNVNALKNSLNQNENQLSQTKNEMTQIQNQQTQIRNQMNSLKNQIAEAEERGDKEAVAKLSHQYQSLEKTYQQLDSRYAQAKNRYTQLEQAVASQRRELADSEQKLSSIRSQLSASQGQLSSLKTQLNEATQNRVAAQNSLNSKQSSLNQIQSELPGLRSQLSAKRQQLSQKQNEITQIENQIQLANNQVQQLTQQRNGEVAKRAPIVNEISQIDAECNPLIQDYDQKLAQYRSYERDLRDCERRVREIEANLLSNQETMRRYDEERNQIYVDVRRYEEHQSQLRIQISELTTESARLWSEFKTADQNALVAETLTQKSYEKYAAVKENYDGLVQAAVAEGASQGQEMGRREGSTKGFEIGEGAAKLQGQKFAKKVAGLESYQRGLERGLDTGRTQGYKDGFELPDNRKRGYELGYQAGFAKAKEYLQSTVYVDARLKFKSEAIEKSPEKWVDLVNDAEQKTLSSINTVDLESVEKIKALSSALIETRALEDADEKVRKLIALTKSENMSQQKEMEQLAKTQVFPDGVVISDTLSNCNQTYIDFVRACKKSFVDSYKQKYISSYGESYLESRNSLFSEIYQRVFSEHVDSRLQEGVDASYPIVFAKHQLLGAKDAENQGFAEGHSAGYAQKDNSDLIESARNRGTQDEKSYFAHNPVVRLKNLFIEPLDKNTGFVPGAYVVVRVEAANYGARDSSRSDLRLSLISTNPSVRFTKTTTELVEIPTDTGARVGRVFIGQISPHAPWNEIVRVRVKAEYGDQVVEEKETQFKVQFALDIETKIEGDKKPDIRHLFGFYDHVLKVTLLNKSTNVLGKSFRVLSVKSIEYPDVAFYINQADFGPLVKGEIRSVELGYEIRNKSYKGKTINLEFVYMYGETEELKKETFTIQPID